MNNLLSSSAELCYCLVQDAIGNGSVGDVERNMLYLELAARGLELHRELLKSPDDVGVQRKAREFQLGINAELDKFPPLTLG